MAVTTKKKAAATTSAPTTRARRTAAFTPVPSTPPRTNGHAKSVVVKRQSTERDEAVNKSGSPKLGKGGLASLVIEHMKLNPKAEFTPSELGHVLNRSGGAVANALDKFKSEGDVVQTSEKPKRYRFNTKKKATRGAAKR